MIEFSQEQAKNYVADLAREHQKKLVRYILCRMDEKDEDEAEDIVQEVMCRVLSTIMNKREPLKNGQAYLFAAARREHARRAKKQGLSTPVDDLVDLPDPSGQPEQIFEHRERLEATTEQIQAIPQKMVRMAMDRLSKGDTLQEISEEFHLQMSTTKSYIARGQKVLRETQQKDEEGDSIS